MQREQRADHAMQRSDRIAEREVRARRRPVGKAGEVAHAADPFSDRGESRALTIRSGLAVTRDPHEDQLRVVARKRVPAEVPLLERAGPEILDHDLRAAGKAPHDLLALGTAQVAGHRFLVPGLHMPPERGAVPDAAPLAQGVALARRLDLDHFGAEVAERLGAERPGDQAAELEDADAVERTYLRFSSRRGLYSSTLSPRWFTTWFAKRTRPRSPFEVRRCSMTSAATWIVSPTSVGPLTSRVALRNASPVSCIVGSSR